MSKKVVLAGACRTAIGKMGGALSNTPAADLGAIVIKEALNRAGVKPEMVDEVKMGCVIQAAQGHRAFLKDAPIILLDEATASLDVDNETMIQESLSRLIKDKTVMIIAHRMRTVANADKIVVLKDGVVAESGTPSELDAKDGIYANMVKTQNLAADWAL